MVINDEESCCDICGKDLGAMLFREAEEDHCWHCHEQILEKGFVCMAKRYRYHL